MGKMAAEDRAAYFNQRYQSGRFAVLIDTDMVVWATLNGPAYVKDRCAVASFIVEDDGREHVGYIDTAWSEATAPSEWRMLADDPEK